MIVLDIIKFFYISTVYKRLKDDVKFFVHKNNKILNIPDESIGYVVKARLINENNEYKTFDFLSISSDIQWSDIITNGVTADVLLIKKIKYPKYLFGVIMNQEELEEIGKYFSHSPYFYQLPQNYPYVKISHNKAHLSGDDFNTIVNNISKDVYICKCFVYHATSNLLYAHPIKYYIDKNIDKSTVEKIKRSIKKRDKYSRIKKLMREISFIYKNNNIKIHNNYIKFTAHGNRYKINFKNTNLYENNKLLHVKCSDSLCHEYIILIKLLNVINRKLPNYR